MNGGLWLVTAGWWLLAAGLGGSCAPLLRTSPVRKVNATRNRDCRLGKSLQGHMILPGPWRGSGHRLQGGRAGEDVRASFCADVESCLRRLWACCSVTCLLLDCVLCIDGCLREGCQVGTLLATSGTRTELDKFLAVTRFPCRTQILLSDLSIPVFRALLPNDLCYKPQRHWLC